MDESLGGKILLLNKRELREGESCQAARQVEALEICFKVTSIKVFMPKNSHLIVTFGQPPSKDQM